MLIRPRTDKIVMAFEVADQLNAEAEALEQESEQARRVAHAAPYEPPTEQEDAAEDDDVQMHPQRQDVPANAGAQAVVNLNV